MKNFTKGWLALTLVALIGCAASTPPAVGVWGVEMNTPLGNIPAPLTNNHLPATYVQLDRERGK